MNDIKAEIRNQLQKSKPDIEKLKSLFESVLSDNDQLISNENGYNSHINQNDTVQYLEALTANIPGTNVFVVDRDMNVIYANGKEMEEFGFSRRHYEGRNFLDLWKKDEASLLKPLYVKALKGRRIIDEVSFADDFYHITIIPLRNPEGEVDSCISIMTNITSEINQKLDSKKAREQAEAASRAKSEFMANMSHEIRTPLNSVIGFTEQLGKTTLDSEQRKFLNLIESASEHLLSIVNEILILMKIGSGSLFIEHIPFPVRSVFNQSVNVLKFKAKKKGLDFNYNVSNEMPEVLIGDPVRFKQIMINLLSNAIKFTELGLVRCNLGVKKIRDKVVTVELTVKDSGIGIHKEEMDTIFNAFAQSDTSETRKYGGSGLGLTIVKALVEMQNGTIGVKSAKNRGTTFTVELPFEIGSPEEIDEDDQSFEYNTDLVAHLRILLVDDDETNRLLAKTILKSWKVLFDEAQDGKRALNLLEKNKYDLVLMDIHMPEISGTEIVKKVRDKKHNINRHTRFIAVTANIIKEDLSAYESAGMDDHLIKPYREESLFNKICKVMDIKAGKNVDKRGGEGITDLEIESEPEKPYDLNELISVAKGDVYFFNKTLKSYIQSAEEIKSSAKDLDEISDKEKIGEKAHKLISSSRFLGLSEIANICVQIEDTTLKDKSGDISRIKNQLITKLDEVLPMLKNEYIRN